MKPLPPRRGKVRMGVKTMDLALTETQQMLKRLTRDLLEREFPPSLARELEHDQRGHSPEVWRKMVETGLVNAAFPQEYGGAGGSLTDLGVIFDEMGRGLYTGPFFATVALGGLTLLYAATEDQRHGLIPAVAEGQALLSLALLEESGKYAPETIRLEAHEKGDHFVLSASSCSWSTPTSPTSSCARPALAPKPKTFPCFLFPHPIPESPSRRWTR